MRNNTTILLRAMARLMTVFIEVPLDISWNCSASQPARRLCAEMEDPPAPQEIELTYAIATMGL
jgi:hypothetical protein